jgi:hypothetical protein
MQCLSEVCSNYVCVRLVCYFSSLDATCKPQHIYTLFILFVNADEAHSEEVGSSTWNCKQRIVHHDVGTYMDVEVGSLFDVAKALVYLIGRIF